MSEIAKLLEGNDDDETEVLIQKNYLLVNVNNTKVITRLLDGVISKGSLESESFNENLLDYPVYTKPRNFRGMEVPEVLISGDHKKIEEYRKSEQLRITKEKREDLL